MVKKAMNVNNRYRAQCAMNITEQPVLEEATYYFYAIDLIAMYSSTDKQGWPGALSTQNLHGD
jgi:hypothetical protein